MAATCPRESGGPSESARRFPLSARHGIPVSPHKAGFIPNLRGVAKPPGSQRSDDFLRERTTCNKKPHTACARPKDLVRLREGPSSGRGSRPLGSAGEILRSAPRSIVPAGCVAAPPSGSQSQGEVWQHPLGKHLSFRGSAHPVRSGKQRSQLARPKNLPPLARSPSRAQPGSPRVTERSCRSRQRFFSRHHTPGRAESTARCLPQNDRLTGFVSHGASGVVFLCSLCVRRFFCRSRHHADVQSYGSVAVVMIGEMPSRRVPALTCSTIPV